MIPRRGVSRHQILDPKEVRSGEMPVVRATSAICRARGLIQIRVGPGYEGRRCGGERSAESERREPTGAQRRKLADPVREMKTSNLPSGGGICGWSRRGLAGIGWGLLSWTTGLGWRAPLIPPKPDSPLRRA